jgi:hypothetical protein
MARKYSLGGREVEVEAAAGGEAVVADMRGVRCRSSSSSTQ